MSRSPWRDALDGKIKIIHDMRQRTSFVAVAEYLRTGLQVKGATFTDQQLLRAANGYHSDLIETVQEAEPFYVSNEMVVAFQEKTHDLDLSHVVSLDDLPVRNGLFWFPGLIEVTDTPDRDDPIRSLWVRAVTFKHGKHGEYKPSEGLRQKADSPDVVGVMLFIDAARSGINVERGTLLPFLYQPIEVGQTLQDYCNRTARTYGNVSHDLAHQLWGALFLWAAFKSMQQEIIRFGRADIEREARKQARRAGISSSVQVIEWRKVRYVEPAHEAAHVEWSCRWEVKQHTRRLKSGRTTTVRPYVKGPRDKPLRAKRQRIHLVDR